MAKDVTEKPVSSSNSDNNSPPTSDQQRVPPLRIVLNVSGNQKSSSSSASGAGSTNQPDLKREKSSDSPSVKPGGKVRIKLGTGKPANRGNNNTRESESVDKASDESHRARPTRDQDSSPATKDDSSINYSHLRRITRRSQRTIQTISNEDEESISSMISTDENQNSNSNNNTISAIVNNSDSNGASLDCAPATSAQTSTAATSSANGGGTSTSSDTPRRKRKKGESTTETPLIDYESTFNFQNYRISVQNSFELFKNIRKHVDKKLKTLSSIHPKAPHGFRDYMLTRGAYLLDGNKLGNGTNLFMNEDGGLNPAPMGKYHALRHNRVNYTVPNRAKVPLGLPVNSPLYNLFIEQEKERYRMQIQHIKEREKLTLAVEQEIMRVYNQAAMAAVNQDEPFSACTMLKHQEIYNYLDSDGVAILASEDARLDQVKPNEPGVRTRRRQHEQITSPTRKTSTTNETSTTQSTTQKVSAEPAAATKDESNNDDPSKTSTVPKDENKKSSSEKSSDKNHETPSDHQDGNSRIVENRSTENPSTTEDKQSNQISGKGATTKSLDIKSCASDNQIDEQKTDEIKPETTDVEGSEEHCAQVKVKTEPNASSASAGDECNSSPKEDADDSKESGKPGAKIGDAAEVGNETKKSSPVANSQSSEDSSGKGNNAAAMDVDEESKNNERTPDDRMLSEDDVKAYNREVFLSQLQGIDDKWERIRAEMLIRHRNEAESLHAVQKLEWEWKTKEIGACDVRVAPVIDETLVPKLNIYSQDY